MERTLDVLTDNRGGLPAATHPNHATTLVVVALYNPSLTLYLLGSAIALAGAGLLFKAALSVATTAEPGSTAGVLAMFFVIAYLGPGLPPVLLTAART